MRRTRVLVLLLCLYTVARLIRPGDQCPHTLRFSANRTVVVLASYPGSGNTWLRELIESATGLYTSSAVREPTLEPRFEVHGRLDGSVAVVKTHHWIDVQHAIILVRDPLDTLKAEFNRRFSNHTGHASPEQYAKHWDDHARLSLVQWQMFHWIFYSRLRRENILTVTYDDLRTSTHHTLHNILSYLNISVTGIQCALGAPKHFHRPRGISVNTSAVFREARDRVWRMVDNNISAADVAYFTSFKLRAPTQWLRPIPSEHVAQGVQLELPGAVA